MEAVTAPRTFSTLRMIAKRLVESQSRIQSSNYNLIPGGKLGSIYGYGIFVPEFICTLQKGNIAIQYSSSKLGNLLVVVNIETFFLHLPKQFYHIDPGNCEIQFSNIYMARFNFSRFYMPLFLQLFSAWLKKNLILTLLICSD